MLEMSKETAAEEEGVRAVKEGEVTGAARELEEVVIIDEPEQLTNAVPDAPASEFTLPGQLDWCNKKFFFIIFGFEGAQIVPHPLID